MPKLPWKSDARYWDERLNRIDTQNAEILADLADVKDHLENAIDALVGYAMKADADRSETRALLASLDAKTAKATPKPRTTKKADG